MSSKLHLLRRPATDLLRKPSSISGVNLRNSSSSHLPRIAQPELWHSIIPKFLRRSPGPTSKPLHRSGNWTRNPSGQIIVLALLAGSQAIQIIQLKSSSEEKQKMIDRRLNKLAEVIKRVQAGEEVDIKKELQTGDPEAEKEWQDVLDQIPDDNRWLREKTSLKGNKDEKGGLTKISRLWSWNTYHPSTPGAEPPKSLTSEQKIPQPQQLDERPRTVGFY